MSHDVLAQLNGLRDHVRARIEATTDYKALQSVEKAIGEVQALMPVAAAAAEAPAEAAAAEVAIAEATCEATDTVVEADAEAPVASELAAEPEAPAESTEAVAEADAEDAPAEAVAEAAADAANDVAAEPPVEDVKVAQIPAEDRPLVAELVAAAAELPASAANANQ